MLEFPRWKIAVVVVITALSLYTALPNILTPAQQERYAGWLTNKSVPLGLDLRGGSHLLLALDFDTYKRDHFTQVRDALREQLRKAKVGYLDLRASGNEVVFRIRPETVTDGVNLAKIYRSADPDLTVEEKNGTTRLYYDDAKLKQMQIRLIDQSIEIVQRRVDESGTKEPIIQRQGTDRIVVQVPGLDDPAELKRLLGKTAKMTFHLVNESVTSDQVERNMVPSDTLILSGDRGENEEGQGARYPVLAQVALGGENLTNANVGYQNGLPVVEFTFNRLGADKFGQITQANIGRRFAVVLDDKVITAPVIRSAILGGRGIIEGNFSVESANELAVLLRAGALPAPLTVIEERSVGPSLGQDSINAGTAAAVLGIVLVLLFMFLSYGFFGIIANIGLAVHFVMVFGLMSLIGATLSLPGIAGIVLTMGMGVDANVLIFERVRDELRFGKSPAAALDHGFDLAWGTIFDSNITTLIAAGLLYTLGAGAVKGFAVTLTIGIMSSMFASVMLCRMLIVLWARKTKPKTLPI